MVVISSYKVKARHFRFSLSAVKDIYMQNEPFPITYHPAAFNICAIFDANCYSCDK